ncbi:tyrosine protein phosphatase [Deltaproteobacteria bacterium]|nr:tyrosine protein phosphatase [Deltaproteobacteria bacterium]
MIDIHSHILPGVDDGPPSMEGALEMARIAADDGTHTIVAAPHCLNGSYINWRTTILSACMEINLALDEHHIPVTVLPGSEIHMSLEILDELKKGRIMTINDTGRYFSMELPEQFIPETVIAFINRLQIAGVRPVISHPERNRTIQNDIKLLGELISAGALSQVTAGSLTGGFGRRAVGCCMEIVEKGMLHLVASDAHSPEARRPGLSRAYEKLASLAGMDTAKEIFFRMPQAVINGKISS